MRDWSGIRHFEREEWVHNPDKITWDVVLMLDEMRDAAGIPIAIHVAWDSGGHQSDSAHYTIRTEEASAVDFHFVGWPLLDQWLFAERFPWVGIGLYPFWQHPGLHCDLRRLGLEHPDMGRRWWCDRDGIYKPIDRELMSLLTT